MLSLRARFDACEVVIDRPLDCLVIADLEVQAGLWVSGAPIAAVQTVTTDQVQRPSDVDAVAFGEDQ